ncbi:MAG: toprim domain-containing protein [Ginsengibacter sp.]
MKCEEANQIDMVDHLASLGFHPTVIKGNDYWYLSPFRNEKTASFKIQRSKNVWYDHGIGTGGGLVDFVKQFYHCDASEALQKIVSFHAPINFKNSVDKSPLNLHENSLMNYKDARETGIKIIAANEPIMEPWLCRYLKQRRIEKFIANKYCHEVQFVNGEKEKIFNAIGFKNNAGGYELRNAHFKGSSSPKYISYLDNKADNLTVFEGFFDFLSYQSLHQNQQHFPTNFLVLNSTAFFQKSLPLMEKHDTIHLYLDNDLSGKTCTEIALKISSQFKDESTLYKGYKDLNDWIVNFGKRKQVKHSLHR